MEKAKQVLKNDQNNHLCDQIAKFEKIAPAAKKNHHLRPNSSYETLNLDTVTSAYVRGYN